MARLLLPLAPRTLLTLLPLALLLALTACADDGDVPPDISAPAAGTPDVASGQRTDDVVPGERGNVPLDDFLLEPEVVVGPHAEVVLAAAEGGTATGAALFVPDAARGLVLYYRVGELGPGVYALHLGRECGAEGAAQLGTAEPAPTGVASGQLLLDTLPGPKAAAGQVLMVTDAAGRSVACGPVSMVGTAATAAP